ASPSSFWVRSRSCVIFFSPCLDRVLPTPRKMFRCRPSGDSRLLRMSRRGQFCRFALCYAGSTIDADGRLTPDGGPANYPFLVTVIIDGAMLGGGIVPYYHVARAPAPAHRIFELGYMGLEQFEQVAGVRLRIPDETADKIAEHERALAGLGKDANDRMFGLVDRRRDNVLVVLDGC